MDRASRLKHLNDELRRLFSQNASEQEAYDQVKDDPRFDSVRLAKVSTMYKQFRSEKGMKPKRKKSVDPQLAALLYRSGQLAYFRSTLECNHEENWCLKFRNGFSSDGRFFITYNRMMEANNESNFSLKDVFGNKSCGIKIPIAHTTEEWKICPLTHDIGLLTEDAEEDDQNMFFKCSLSLLELDWTEKEMQKIHTFTFEDQLRHFNFHKITVNAMDPTRFLLQLWHDDDSTTLKIGQVRNGEIVFGGDILPTNQDIGGVIDSFVGNTLYSFDPWDFVDFNEACIDVTQLDQDGQTSHVILDSIPEKFSTVNGEDYIVGCFAMERVCLAVQHKKTKYYGIIWTDCKTREWQLVKFYVKKPITELQFMANGYFLCIQTTDKETEVLSDVHQVQKTFYRIPLKKPEKLSDLAWFSLVRSKSKLKGVDPYEESRRYLPFYSEIRCPFEE